MNELHLFAGAGGGILGGMLLGHTCVCAVEIEPYPREILLQRQRDGILPKFPIWDDVRTFDGIPWRGKIDCICGGFPCTDIAPCGKGAGIKGEHSSLWGEMARIIDEVRPRYTFIENSAMLNVRGIDRVLCDLSRLGYNARWCTLGGECLGKTQRKRIWILGQSNYFSLAGFSLQERTNIKEQIRSTTKPLYDPISKINRRTPIALDVRMDYGIPHWVDRFKATGMAQIPSVAATAFMVLKGDFEKNNNNH